MKTIKKRYYIVQNVKNNLLKCATRCTFPSVKPMEMKFMKVPRTYYYVLVIFCVLIICVSLAGASRASHTVNSTYMKEHGYTGSNPASLAPLKPLTDYQEHNRIARALNVSSYRMLKNDSVSSASGNQTVHGAWFANTTSTHGPAKKLAISGQNCVNRTEIPTNTKWGNAPSDRLWLHLNGQDHTSGKTILKKNQTVSLTGVQSGDFQIPRNGVTGNAIKAP
jgi:hypothetical protein